MVSFTKLLAALTRGRTYHS